MQKYKKNFLKSRGMKEPRDDLLCEWCWERIASDIHHVRFRSLGGSDAGDNLIALCRPCHDAAHRSEISENVLLERTKLTIAVIEEM